MHSLQSMYVCVFVCVCVCVCVICSYAYAHGCASVCVCVCVCMRHLCVCVCVCVCGCIEIYTYCMSRTYMFNLFDADGSGEIGLAELLAAFRRLGVELTLREAEKLIADADEDGNGIVDVDEFVEMVENMLGFQHGYVELHHVEDKEGEGMASTDGTRAARTPTVESQTIKSQAGGGTQNKQTPSNQAANDEDDDNKQFQGVPTEPVCCGLFRVDRCHFEPNALPLSTLRWLVARLLNAPCRIDECGNQIPNTLITMARLRNVELRFGPSARAWQAWSTGKGAIMNSAVPDTQQKMDPALRREIASTLHFPMGAKLPDGNGSSVSVERHDIKDYLGTNSQKGLPE